MSGAEAIDIEKLGAFYLGRLVDSAGAPARGDQTPLLYDAKDLTTHAVCVGMTGSGKTGLGVALLEEAAIDGIPAIAIDPKGDLGNLLLTFPALRPEDFQPWVDPAAAGRKGLTVDEHAARTAELWRNGLAEWGEGPERIERLRKSVQAKIYTPGSTAGNPLSILGSFAAPPAGLRADREAMADRVEATVAGLLSLLGIDADPLTSREHILLANLLDRAWSDGRGLALVDLVREIQEPPLERIGVLDLESFFPARERFGLAMRLNNLLASPGFSVWMEGDPLDVGALLYDTTGRPRLSVLSIAHLSETERMFFVTILLNEIVAWVRSQAGTTSLRAILYMDEVFGYLPPVANPPSKKPLLTLLKQARAYGLGVVLATQNPVDLDYKALSNAGTWFLGRLQTERDKLRVLDGLEGASAGGFDRKEVERLLAGLASRVFLMQNAHDDHPVLFQTRWTLSYLAGPLTREQIRRLTDAPASSEAPVRGDSVGAAAAVVARAAEAEPAEARPLLDPAVPEFFLRTRRAPVAGERLRYRPALLGAARLHYVDRKASLDHWQPVTFLAPLGGDDTDPWNEATPLDGEVDLGPEPQPGADFDSLPPAATRTKSYAAWAKDLAAHLYRERPLDLFYSAALKRFSTPGERQADFVAGLTQAMREQRDLEVEKLRSRYAPRRERLLESLRRADERIAREQAQATHQKLETAVSFGATLIGALFGRRAVSATTIGRATTAARGVARSARQSGDVTREIERKQDLGRKLEDLEAEIATAAARIGSQFDPTAVEVEEYAVRARKSDVQIDRVILAWTPWLADDTGKLVPAS